MDIRRIQEILKYNKDDYITKLSLIYDIANNELNSPLSKIIIFFNRIMSRMFNKQDVYDFYKKCQEQTKEYKNDHLKSINAIKVDFIDDKTQVVNQVRPIHQSPVMKEEECGEQAIEDEPKMLSIGMS